MVAEVVPEKRRVEAGALLYTSAPMGLFLATFVNFQIAGVLLQGLARDVVALRVPVRAGPGGGGVRGAPVRARSPSAGSRRPPDRRRTRASPSCSRPSTGARTLSGFAMAVIALITWWGCNAFIPIVVDRARPGDARRRDGLDRAATLALVESWKARATNCFNLGGLIGTLLTIPAAKMLGRRKMFAHLLRGCPASPMLATFGLDLPPETRLYMYFFIGLTRVRRVRQLHVLPARAVPDAPARDRRRLLLQRRPHHRRRRARSWSGRSPRAAPTRSPARCTCCSGSASCRSLGVLLLAPRRRDQGPPAGVTRLQLAAARGARGP